MSKNNPLLDGFEPGSFRSLWFCEANAFALRHDATSNEGVQVAL